MIFKTILEFYAVYIPEAVKLTIIFFP